MVLEDISNTPPTDFTTDSTPTSDLDPYAGNSTQTIESRPSAYVRVQDNNPPIYVNLASLPRPFNAPSGSSNDAKLYRYYGDQIKKIASGASQAVQRPLTQQEADALAESFANTFRKSSLGFPLGLALAALQYARTMRKCSFPFWQPFKEGSKLSPYRFGPLRGKAAQLAWHSSRGAAYGVFLGGFVGPSLSGLWAMTGQIKDRSQDPRLRDIMESLQKRTQHARQQQNAAQRQTMEASERASQRGESVEMSRKRAEVRVEEARRRRANAANASVDDMSPTGGAFAEETRLQSDGFVSDDWAAPQEQQAWQRPDTSSSSSPPLQQSSEVAPPNNRPQRQSNASQQPSFSGRQSGSAWDRLRQDAMSKPIQSKGASVSASASARPQSNEESFSFSQGEEGKQLAQSEAQREFDARVEREREGGDFGESGRGGKRW